MEMTVIDLSPYLNARSPLPSSLTHVDDPHLRRLCHEVARTLKETGALLVHDPRCSAADNDRFLDMMESYFHQSPLFKHCQERPSLHYQVGVTPEGVEVPRCLVDEGMQQRIACMPKETQPVMPIGPDPKWRYMWRVGPRPSNSRFKVFYFPPILILSQIFFFKKKSLHLFIYLFILLRPLLLSTKIPDGFPEWAENMDSWGYKMISAVEAVAEMAAIGFGLEKDAFTSLMNMGPHLLAPTGSDLEQYGHEGTVFAGYHCDLNFLTIHGKSRFPGLNIWLRNGQKIEVKVPVGCLLIQTGKELEWLTGGECLAGMHEVVVTNRTTESMQLAQKQNRSLWRVSSTLFAHIASDAILKPLGHFSDSASSKDYPPIFTGEYVEKELSVINLKGRREE